MINDCVFIPKSLVDQTLNQDSEEGKRLLEALKTLAFEHKLPINILEDTNVSNDVEVHRHEGDLWICLSGEVEFVVGGSLIEPWAKQLADGGTDDRELKSKTLSGGKSHKMSEGDVLWIPAGQPHMHKTVTTARLFIIKVPVPEEISLSEVPGWITT